MYNTNSETKSVEANFTFITAADNKDQLTKLLNMVTDLQKYQTISVNVIWNYQQSKSLLDKEQHEVLIKQFEDGS